VNSGPDTGPVNTIFRPVIISPVIEKWLENYRFRSWYILSVILIFTLVSALFAGFWKRGESVLSIYTTGISAGAYSICLMMIFQARYGSLYLYVSLLLLFLYAGFSAGSLIKKFRGADYAIGLFIPVSMLILITMPSEFKPLFYAFHFIIGAGAGAQFRSVDSPSQGILNTADLAGGVAGTALVPAVIIPEFGIVPVIAGISILKLLSGLAGLRYR
ncbi:MAG: hypothetical protein ACOCSE_06355, partial [Chitinivibrionales bacterium]